MKTVKNIEDEVGNLDGILHAIAFSPTDAMGGNFLNTTVEDAVKSFEISAFSLKTLATSFQPILNKPSSIVALDFDNSQAWPGYDWQGVAKSSLQSIVRYLGYYMGDSGVRVNAVAAGPLATTAAKIFLDFLKWIMSGMNELHLVGIQKMLNQLQRLLTSYCLIYPRLLQVKLFMLMEEHTQ